MLKLKLMDIISIKSYHKNARRKRWNFNLGFKILALLAVLISNGNALNYFKLYVNRKCLNSAVIKLLCCYQ